MHGPKDTNPNSHKGWTSYRDPLTITMGTDSSPLNQQTAGLNQEAHGVWPLMRQD